MDIESGGRRRINENSEGVRGQVWSADSRWLAFAETARNTFTQIKLYDSQGGAVDLTGATIFLAADGAGFVSGVTLPIDGAYLCNNI